MAWTAPRTWVATNVLTAAQLNTDVRDNSLALYATATSYTPTLGVWTLGNGTATGYYGQSGPLVFFWANITFGSTSVFTAGEPTITLPVAPNSTYTTENSIRVTMRASLADNSGSGEQTASCYNLSGSTVKVLYHNATGTPITGSVLSSTAPFTWATSDQIRIGGFYWVA